MASKNSINLLETIKKERNNELIIFTTFVFDPIFFDGYVLRKLKQNNPKATIIVLMDRKIYSTLHDEFTNETGVEYALVPISGNLFHSKIFLFKSKSKSKVLLGSHNLTLSGITQNLELSFESDDEELVSDCLEYIGELFRNNLDSKNPLLKRIEPFLKNTRNSILITNQDTPILEQALSKIKKHDMKINEIIVFSPYFSKVEEISKQLLSLNPKEIRICVQKNNHDLETKNLKNSTKISFNELIQKSDRRAHSKFIVFRGSQKDLILVGSPNFTSQALLKTSKDGNFETALLIESDYQLFSQSFKIEPISEIDIKDSQRKIFDSSMLTLTFPIMINFAYFDDFGRLYIEYDSKISDDVELKLISNVEIRKKIRVNSGKNTISIDSVDRAVNEIMILKDGKPISNNIRICSPKEMKIGIEIDLEDPELIQKALSEVIDFEDIANFCFAFFSTDEEKIGDYEHSPTQERVPMPARRNPNTVNLGILDILNRLFRISTKPSKGHSESETKQPQSPTSEHKEIDELISDLIPKLTKKFEKEIIQKTSFTKRYSVFLVISLKLIKKISTKKIRGCSAVSAITGLNNMIANDISFTKLSSSDKLEIMYLLINLAKEAQQNLSIPYKFDNEAILSEFKSLIVNLLHQDDPIGKLFHELKQSEKFGFDSLAESDISLLEEFFQQELIRLPVSDRMEICKKLILNLEVETDYNKISWGYSTLRLFLSKDSELRQQISYQIKSLKNIHNVDAIKRIISEYN